MTEEQLNNIFRQLFETENGKIVLDNLSRVILEAMPYSNRQDADVTTDSLLREGARELLCYIQDRIDNRIKDDLVINQSNYDRSN